MLPNAKRGLRLARFRTSPKKERLSHCLKRPANLVMLNLFASFVLALWLVWFFARMENVTRSGGNAGSTILDRVHWK
jgi:hypothetical protein